MTLRPDSKHAMIHVTRVRAIIMQPGQSTVVFERPDTTVWRFDGDVSEDAMRALTRRESQFIDGCPYLLKLVDMTHAGNITAGARKAGAAEGVEQASRALYG
jgi:hypothetical protein